MKPTRRAILLFAATIPLSLAVVLANDSLWPFGFVLLAAAIFLTGLDGIRALSPRALEVETHTPGVLYAGGSDDLQVTLRAATRAAPASIEMLCDVSANLHMPPNRQVTLTGDGLGRTSAPLTPMRRGAANVERLWLRWRGPMGLMERLRVEELALEIPVVPNVRAVRNAAIRFTAWDAPTGIKPQNQQGDGSEFESLRDYVPGLDHRSIDWKHSARHRELVCKEFRAERNHQIIMAIDTGHLMSEPMDGIPKLDHAINNALVLGYACLRHGDRIGIFGFDSQTRLYAEPVGGMHYYNHFLRTSAKLEYRPDETNFTLGLNRVRRHHDRRADAGESRAPRIAPRRAVRGAARPRHRPDRRRAAQYAGGRNPLGDRRGFRPREAGRVREAAAPRRAVPGGAERQNGHGARRPLPCHQESGAGLMPGGGAT
jgi:uncharacterized protein (DUF58 family)